MKIACYQGPVVFGDPQANLETIERVLEEATAAGTEIVCFPETFLQGYFPTREQGWANSIDLESSQFADVLARLNRFDCAAIVGLNERRGELLYNTVVVVERGKLLGRYSKNYLVYKYFERGGEFPVFERRGVKYGAIICADTSYIEPARILAMKGAQIIFTPHFNYIGYDKLDDHTWRVEQHHVAIAIDNNVYVARSNVVVPESTGYPIFGREGVGVGNSLILNRRARVLAKAGLSSTTLIYADLPEDDLGKPAFQPWQRCSPEMAMAMHEQYQRLFATHGNEG